MALTPRAISALPTTFTTMQSGDWLMGDRAGVPFRITYQNIQASFLSPLTIAADNARINLHDTIGTASTHAIAGLAYNNGQMTLVTRTSTGEFVQTAYSCTMDATGSSGHIFRVGASDILRISGAGTTAFNGITVRAPEFPALDLRSDNASDAFKAVRLVRGLSNFALTVVNSVGGFVQTCYNVVLDASGAVSHSFQVGGTNRLTVNSSGISVTGVMGVSGGISASSTSSMQSIFPSSDNAFDLGNVIGAQWRFIHLRNAPVVSSDARLKENIADPTDDDFAAILRVKFKTFTMKDGAQENSGYIAQQIIEAFGGDARPLQLGLLHMGGDGFYGVKYELVTALRVEALARSLA